MTLRNLIKAGAVVSALAFSAVAVAVPAPVNPGPCALSDVKQGTGAGATNAVDCIGVLGGQGDNVNDNSTLVNLTNVGPSLLGTPTPRFFGGAENWVFGGKQNVGGANDTGVLGVNGVQLLANNGWSVSGLGSYGEFMIILKQANFLGAYLFTDESIGNGTWSTGQWDINQAGGLSHLSVWVRGTAPRVPEPATLGLLGLGLLGAGLARRRKA